MIQVHHANQIPDASHYVIVDKSTQGKTRYDITTAPNRTQAAYMKHRIVEYTGQSAWVSEHKPQIQYMNADKVEFFTKPEPLLSELQHQTSKIMIEAALKAREGE